MAKREIWHEIHINAPANAVYRAVAEREKIAGWWTTDVRGESARGKCLEFWFYNHFAAEMKVAELKANSRVRWVVTSRSIPEWVDTDISFKIARRGKKTILHLRHSNWKESAKMFPECSMHWAIYLLSLKEFVETGRGRPHPYDMPVNI